MPDQRLKVMDCPHSRAVCVVCGQLVNVKSQSSKGWIPIEDLEPIEDGEILFVAKDGVTEERIGWAVPEDKMVILNRTDIHFESILCWMPIPASPFD
jgi:hypothetical protein